MPFNATTGVYTAPENSWNPAVAGTVIDPDDWNATQLDYEGALSNLNVRTIDSFALAETSTIPAAVDGIRLLGFYEVGDGGGALYKRSGSEPSHPGKFQSADGAWWEIAEDVLYLEMFGGEATPAFNNAQALSDAIDCANATTASIAVNPGSYEFTCGPSNAPAVPVADANVMISGDGTFVQNGDGPILEVTCPFTNVVTISAIDLVTVNMSSGTTTASPSHRLTVSSVDGYAALDRIKVVSDDIIAGTNPANEEREGEFAVIFSVDAINKYIYTIAPLVFAQYYLTNPRVGRMNTDAKVSISGLSFESDGTLGNQAILSLIGLYRPVLKDLKCSNSQAEFVKTTSCVNAFGAGIVCDNLRTSSGGANGYGWIDYNSEGTIFTNNHIRNSRHGYTTGALAVAVDSDIAYYGRSKYGNISNNLIEYNQAAGIDTHQDAYGYVISDNVIKQTYRGYTGGVQGISIRGTNHLVEGNKTFGGNGYRAYASTVNSDPASPDSLNNVTFRNNEHTFLGWEDGIDAMALLGESTVQKRGMVVDGFIVRGPMTDCSSIHAEWVEADISNLYAEVQAQDPGSATSFGVIRVDGATVNLGANNTIDTRMSDNSSGNVNIRTFSFGEDGNNINCAAPIRHIAGSPSNRWVAVLSTSTLTTSVFNLQAEANVAPSSGWIIGSGTPDLGLKAFLDNGRDATFTPATVTYSTTGNKTVSHGYFGNDTVYRNYIVTTSGVTINNIGASLYIGQRTVWTNDATSTNALTFDANGTNMLLGGYDIVLAAGETLVTTWNGTVHTCTVLPAGSLSGYVMPEASGGTGSNAFATAAEIRTGTAAKVIAVDDLWSAQSEVTISYASSVAPNFATFFDAVITLTGPLTLANGSNLKPGQKGRFRFVQDGTGGHALSVGTDYETTNGAAIVLSTAANAQDIVYYDIIAAGRVLLSIGARAIS